MLQYIVLFQLEEPERWAGPVADKLMSMAGKIPEILRMETGRNVWDNERCYDLALLIDFQDEAALKVYDTHPLHQECRKFIYPHRLDGKTVVYDKAAAHCWPQENCER